MASLYKEKPQFCFLSTRGNENVALNVFHVCSPSLFSFTAPPLLLLPLPKPANLPVNHLLLGVTVMPPNSPHQHLMGLSP